MHKKIIFVHGLGGNPETTWGQFINLLEADLDIQVSCYCYHYPSPHPILRFWSRSPSITRLAKGLVGYIKRHCKVCQDSIILAGYSLGGLIIKKALLILMQQNQQNCIDKVCFFAVPHEGSSYADIFQYIATDHLHLKSLRSNSEELHRLNQVWLKSGLASSIDILSILAAKDQWVSSESASSQFRYHPIEVVDGVSHETLMELDSQSNRVYQLFKEFILSAAEQP